MLAIAINALYAILRRRGTTLQLAGVIVTCVVSALLLLPALLWYALRFSTVQAALSVAEVEIVLVYIVVWGCFLPLGVTVSYVLFTLPRTPTTSLHIPRQKRATRANPANIVKVPRLEPGVVVPFVFGEDTPWGWLEYRTGRLQGQRLALKRKIVTIGRGEDMDILLDDDLASRHHAELAWDEGRVYITDCDSMNGVLVNGRRLRTSELLERGALLEIGSHRLLFDLAKPPDDLTGQDDPLLRHAWHTVASLHQENSQELPMTQPLVPNSEVAAGVGVSINPSTPVHTNFIPDSSQEPDETMRVWQDTAELVQATPLPLPTELTAVFAVCNGEMAGQSFLVDRPVLTIGRGLESDIIINDVSISRQHAQVLRQANGNYVQDLGSRNGTKVNDESLTMPRLLQHGDVVCLGNIRLQYTPIQGAQTAPLSLIITPAPIIRPMSGPQPLRLPSKLKKD